MNSFRFVLFFISLSLGISTIAIAQNRVGIYSGTFDPVHLGHIDLIDRALVHGNLEKVIVYPNLDPPHKIPDLSFEKRWNLLKLATEADDRMFLPPKHVLKKVLTQKHPNEALFKWAQTTFNKTKSFHRIMGADSFEKFLSYPHAVQELKTTAAMGLIVSERSSYKIEIPKELKGKVSTIKELKATGYSSSLYRSAPLKNEYILPESVAKEIQSKGYYGRSTEAGHYDIMRRNPTYGKCFEVFLFAPRL
jgi:nicotinate-nucleotide adenylyltransferase